MTCATSSCAFESSRLTLRASQKTPESLGSWRKASGVKPAAEVNGIPVPPSALQTSPMAVCSASSLSPRHSMSSAAPSPSTGSVAISGHSRAIGSISAHLVGVGVVVGARVGVGAGVGARVGVGVGVGVGVRPPTAGGAR